MKAFCSCKHVLDGCDGVVANKALLVALSTFWVVFRALFCSRRSVVGSSNPISWENLIVLPGHCLLWIHTMCLICSVQFLCLSAGVFLVICVVLDPGSIVKAVIFHTFIQFENSLFSRTTVLFCFSVASLKARTTLQSFSSSGASAHVCLV